VAALLKWRTAAQYILQPHGTFANFGGREVVKTVFDGLFKGIIDGSVDKVVAISEKERVILEKAFEPEKVSLVYHGIAMPQPRTSQVPTFTETLPNKFVLFVGRLHKVKRVDLLLKSFAKSGLINKNINLIIAGNDSGELENLKALATNRHTPSRRYLPSRSPRC
jgi:glycosyltransferase involved in cell wall biosynthesis